MIKYYHKANANVREGKKVATNQVDNVPPKRNHLYALRSNSDPKESP